MPWIMRNKPHHPPSGCHLADSGEPKPGNRKPGNPKPGAKFASRIEHTKPDNRASHRPPTRKSKAFRSKRSDR